MSKIIEVRVPDDVHRKLVDRCYKVGCPVSDYMEASVEYVLTGSSYFDFGENDNLWHDNLSQSQNRSLADLSE